MRAILQTLAMILITVLISSSLAMPHFCFDNDIHTTIEQPSKVKTSGIAKDKQSSKAADHCCTTHHCCSAKLAYPSQTFMETAFYSKADLFVSIQDHFISFDPKGLDRPPKSLA